MLCNFSIYIGQLASGKWPLCCASTPPVSWQAGATLQAASRPASALLSFQPFIFNGLHNDDHDDGRDEDADEGQVCRVEEYAASIHNGRPQEMARSTGDRPRQTILLLPSAPQQMAKLSFMATRILLLLIIISIQIRSRRRRQKQQTMLHDASLGLEKGGRQEPRRAQAHLSLSFGSIPLASLVKVKFYPKELHATLKACLARTAVPVGFLSSARRN